MQKPMERLAKARKQHNRFCMKCVVPDCNGELCGKEPIDSHSIQHNGILSIIADNGKVCFLSETTKNDEAFEYGIKTIGISSKASVFKCLCKEHDDRLFMDIEKRTYNKEPKQNFQFALKALLHSFWEKCNSGKLAEKHQGIHPIADTILEDRIAYRQELNRFWNILQTENYNELITWIVEIPTVINSAACASINVERKLNGERFGDENKDCPLIHVSVFPTDTGNSYMLLSSLKDNQAYFDAFRREFTMLSWKGILKRFNILLPLLIENVMISPHVIQNMTDQQKKELIAIFQLKAADLYHSTGININSWCEQVHYYIF